jgi:hypothetical protein
MNRDRAKRARSRRYAVRFQIVTEMTGESVHEAVVRVEAPNARAAATAARKAAEDLTCFDPRIHPLVRILSTEREQ